LGKGGCGDVFLGRELSIYGETKMDTDLVALKVVKVNIKLFYFLFTIKKLFSSISHIIAL